MKTQKQAPHIKKPGKIRKSSFVITEHILALDNDEHTYNLRISKRARKIQIQINQEGIIQLVLPYRFRKFDHQTFIRSKSDWIKKYLTVNRKDCFFYLGEKINVVPNYDLFTNTAECSIIKNTLTIKLPAEDQRSLKLIYTNWLYQRAVNYLPARIHELAELYELIPQRVTIRKQKTRWGSCSQSGTISLNYKLLILKKELIDYILIHELCHLKEFNHSIKFWKLVEGILPHYRELRKELKQIRIYN